MMYNIISGRMFEYYDFIILLYDTFNKLNPMRIERYSYHITRIKKQLEHDMHYLVGLCLLKKKFRLPYTFFVEKNLESILSRYNNKETWQRLIINCKINVQQLVIKI